MSSSSAGEQQSSTDEVQRRPGGDEHEPGAAQPEERPPARGWRLVQGLTSMFWLAVMAAMSAAVFFVVLGAPPPWATRASSIVFGVIALLFVARVLWLRMHPADPSADPRFRRARERRGY